MSALEDTLVRQLAAVKLPAPEREVLLIPGRRFRADLFWQRYALVVEVDGGIWLPKGRHTTGVGFERDAEKLNLLALRGYRVLRVTAKHIRSGQAVKWIREAMSGADNGIAL